MTHYFLDSMKTLSKHKITTVVNDMVTRLKAHGYSQTPQAEGTRIKLPFLI